MGAGGRGRREPGQWYLHTFAVEQPDLDWTSPLVLDAFDDVLRFWFDRGVDGLRVDAAPAMAKADGLPDADYGGGLRFMTLDWVGNPHWDVDEVHEVFRRWRAHRPTPMAVTGSSWPRRSSAAPSG